jgi:hypothetical protein
MIMSVMCVYMMMVILLFLLLISSIFRIFYKNWTTRFTTAATWRLILLNSFILFVVVARHEPLFEALEDPIIPLRVIVFFIISINRRVITDKGNN